MLDGVAGAAPLGFTLLYVAAQHGDEAEIEWLLSEGAQVDKVAQDGATPLQAACAFGAPGAAALLLSHGAQPSPPISDAHTLSVVTPLHLKPEP
jgi:ankyrin repeat protein